MQVNLGFRQRAQTCFERAGLAMEVSGLLGFDAGIADDLRKQRLAGAHGGFKFRRRARIGEEATMHASQPLFAKVISDAGIKPQ